MIKRGIRVLLSLVLLVTIALGNAGALWGKAAASARLGQSSNVTLSVFDWTSLSSIPYGKALVAQWEALHPGVKVKLLPLPPGDPVMYQNTILAGGSAPDLMVVGYSQQVFPDVPKGWWVDLTPYMGQPNPYAKGYKTWADGFVSATLKPTAFAGSKYYVISTSGADAGFFYNQNLFAKSGIAHVPTTWAELLADGALIKKAGYVPEVYLLGDTYALSENGTVMSLLESQVMGKTFKQLDLNHDGIIDVRELVYGIKHKIYSPMNADYQEAWKLFKQWSQIWQPNAAGNKGYVNGSTTVALQLFLQGKAAMFYGQLGLAPGLVRNKLKFHWSVFKFPQITPASSSFATPGEKPVGVWGSWNGYPWGITNTALKDGHLKLAVDFLQWVTAPQHAVTQALQQGLVPVVKGYQPAANDAIVRTTFDLLSHPAPISAAEVTLGPEWEKQRIAMQQNYILGAESLDQAMSQMDQFDNQAAANAIKLYHLSIP